MANTWGRLSLLLLLSAAVACCSVEKSLVDDDDCSRRERVYVAELSTVNFFLVEKELMLL